MFNIPNALTLLRLFALPVFVVFSISENNKMNLIAALIFGIAALTDWLDGYLARKLNQVTDLGKIIDPLVDRIFVITSMIILYLTVAGIVPLWIILLVATRDLIMVLGWVLLNKYSIRISVMYAGKVSTALLMIALFVLLFDKTIMIDFKIIGLLIFYLGALLSLYSGFKYIFIGFRELYKQKFT